MRPGQLVEIPGETETVGTVLGQQGGVQPGAPGPLTDQAGAQVDSTRDEGEEGAVRATLGIHWGRTVDVPG